MQADSLSIQDLSSILPLDWLPWFSERSRHHRSGHYGPVTDNEHFCAVLIESIAGGKEIEKGSDTSELEKAKHFLRTRRRGQHFKATAKRCDRTAVVAPPPDILLILVIEKVVACSEMVLNSLTVSILGFICGGR
jgi:hypothetical protein